MSKGNRVFHIAALLVGVLGVLTALWPTSIMGECPWLARQSFGSQLYYRFVALTGGGDGKIDPASGLQYYTRDELRAYDGTDPDKPLLLAIGGDVYDVKEKGFHFYGPGMGYSQFAGRDAGRALALGSLDMKDVDNWRIDDFSPAQRKAYKEQMEFYRNKYPHVGKLRPEPDEPEWP
jgi:predicted heme/steroid binding protein